MRTVLTCLWAGHDLPDYSAGKYGPADVLNLWRGVRKHVTDGRLCVLADETFQQALQGPLFDELVGRLSQEEQVALPHTLLVKPMHGYGRKHGGWSHVLEAFNPALVKSLGGSRLLLVGLDTVFVRNSDWLFDEPFESEVGLPADPYNLNGPPCDAVVTYAAAGADIVWTEFMLANESVVWPYPYFGRASEMVLLQALAARHGWVKLEGDYMDRLVSFKAVVRPHGLPDSATIVYFHGSPKPRELPADHPLTQGML